MLWEFFKTTLKRFNKWKIQNNYLKQSFFNFSRVKQGKSVAEWLACWTQAQKGLGSNCSCDAVG